MSRNLDELTPRQQGPGARRSASVSKSTAAMASVVLSVGALAVGVLASSPVAEAAGSSPSPAAIVRVANPPSLPSGATALGRVAATKVISGDVALVPSDSAGLASYAAAVSAPGSFYYQRYLSLGAIEAKFSPSQSSVAAVERQLKSDGLKVTTIAQDRLLVGFRGSAAKVEATFHTAIDNYRLAGGQMAFANVSAVQLPSSIARLTEGVVGLNDLAKPQPAPLEQSSATAGAMEKGPKTAPPKGAADACNAVNQIAAYAGSLAANQVAYAYGLDPLYSEGDFGGGGTIDILDLFGYSSSDIKTFDDCYFGTTNGPKVAARDSYTNVDGGAQPGDGAGGSVETELDVETANAYAPEAKVDVFEAPDSDPGFLDDIAAMTASSAKVETISYGECEETELSEAPGYVQEENYLFEEAAAMGKTVFSSTADNGDDTCSADSQEPVAPILSDSDPASQPYVVGVGGTAITAATNPPSEDVWNDGDAGGSGGGGISDIWPESAWQASTKVKGMNNSQVIAEAEEVDGDGFCQSTYGSSTKCREIPDVSAQASPNTGGFPVFIEGAWNVYGGTSLASPTWAAVLADINSTPRCSVSGGAGFISPKLYAIASVPDEYAASFNDITVGNNDNFGFAGGLYPATKGYDMASGLGSPRVTGAGGAKGLAYYLCAAPAVAPATVTGLSPAALSSSAISSSATLTISGHGFESGGTSDVAGVTVGTITVRPAHYTVNKSSITVSLPTNLLALEEGNQGTGDGSGTYAVTVTLTGGATSTPSAKSTLVLYHSGSGASATTPVVDGTFPSAGVKAGGNSVTVYGSGFTAGGTADVESVTFGGVRARFTVENDNTIRALTPTEPSSAACVAGDHPTTGVCQVQVQVTLKDGTSSAEAKIPLEFSGNLESATSIAGLYAAATEFDFEPTPHISKIRTVSPRNAASESSSTEVVMSGTGLGDLGLEWVNVGSYLNSASVDYTPVRISSTSLTFYLPPAETTAAPLVMPVTVQTYGSPNTAPGKTLGSLRPSNVVKVTYAPTPSVSSMAVAGTSYLAGPTSGGSSLTISGSGFDDADLVYFVDLENGFPATQYYIDVVSNTKITLETPAALTGVYAVEVCGVSGCSNPSSATYTYYLPGNPALTSATPTSGKAGIKVTVTGDNLGYIQAVYFGKNEAITFTQPAFWESGNPYTFTVKVPEGAAGTTVDIQVETIESLATGYGKSHVNKSVTFKYAPAG
ncbi:MAG: IPT/TIG domain-containing protein [Acidimicrobiales bacterium]